MRSSTPAANKSATRLVVNRSQLAGRPNRSVPLVCCNSYATKYLINGNTTYSPAHEPSGCAVLRLPRAGLHLAMSDSPQFEFERRLLEAWPPEQWADCHVLVAVSGGADSVALMRALVALHSRLRGKGALWGAHYNHRWRGAESDADAAWVVDLGQRLGVPFRLGAALEATQPGSEAEARQARYHFLQSAAEEVGARYVVTAHTADDQVETLMLRIFRGTGLSGLAGIPFYRPLGEMATLVRPLLGHRRHEIEAYLAERQLEYRTDASNLLNTYTRNWVRNELLPLVRKELPYPVDASLLRLADQAAEWRTATEQLVDLAVGEHMRLATNPDRVEIDCQHCAGLPAIVLQEACRFVWRRAGWPEQAMRQEDWKRLGEAVRTSAAVPMFPGGIVAERRGDLLVLFAAGGASSSAR